MWVDLNLVEFCKLTDFLYFLIEFEFWTYQYYLHFATRYTILTHNFVDEKSIWLMQNTKFTQLRDCSLQM